ncbi:tolloid-like protein 2 [Trichonephila inaurata madagascariensis]|uniref:Tolloid-like protein 2 n=1 Tax=Trichonephila inaurata madagascariensis TaxID=2747483 RepID=A0A8X6YHB1_9ARAC|nr:tolloid-like protein 2 [Trichonephila inaurata madagascariensis]
MLYKCPKCGKTMQNPSGTLSSPDYSNSVVPQEGTHCEWRITATQGERIILNITEIDIHKSENCDTDYLELRIDTTKPPTVTSTDVTQPNNGHDVLADIQCP